MKNDAFVKLNTKRDSQNFTFIDLFAGIGGMRLGFESIGGRCLFTSEWNRFAQQTYQVNFGDSECLWGDITKVALKHIPVHDVLLAGFPCQPFSNAGIAIKNQLGKPHGFNCKTQGTLFFEIEKIIAAKRPGAFLLENVKHLQSHDKGKTFAVIMDTLQNKLGYRVFTQIVDAVGFVPQHRERLYIVGFKDKVSFDWNKLQRPPVNAKQLNCILHPQNGTETPEPPYTQGEVGLVEPRYTLSNKLWRFLQTHKQKHAQKGNGFGYSLVNKEDIARTLTARYHKDGAEILVSQGQHQNPRRLTPRECARLMGYPDNFVIPVSNTQAYQQFGNSVVVPVVKAIANLMKKPLFDSLLKSDRQAKNDEAQLKFNQAVY